MPKENSNKRNPAVQRAFLQLDGGVWGARKSRINNETLVTH